VSQVAAICDQLSKVSDVDRKTHGKWYEEIAEELENGGLDGDDLTRSSSVESASTSSS
jgi:hypothetical protein